MWHDLPHVIAEFLPLALGVALSPLPLIASAVIALGRDGGMRGTAFAVGRFVGIVFVVAVFAVLSEVVAGLGGPSILLDAVRFLLGLVLVGLGVRTWVKRPGNDDPAAAPPAWIASLDGFSRARSLGLGLLLSLANPKEIAFGAGAGVVIGSTLTEAGPTVAAVTAFALLGCITTVIPVVALLTGGTRIRPALEAARTWLVRENSTITAIVLLFFGVVLVANAFL